MQIVLSIHYYLTFIPFSITNVILCICYSSILDMGLCTLEQVPWILLCKVLLYVHRYSYLTLKMYISQKLTHWKLKCLQYIVIEVTWHDRWTPFPRERNCIKLLQTIFCTCNSLCTPKFFFQVVNFLAIQNNMKFTFLSDVYTHFQL